MTEKKETQEISELVSRTVNGCNLVFQDGEFLGDNWFEFEGNGVQSLKVLLEKYGDEGLKLFNEAYASVLEDRLQKKITIYDDVFKNDVLPRAINQGAPYTPRELAYEREMVTAGGGYFDASSYVTTDDYKETVGLRDVYENFLEQYRDGKPIEVYIPTGSPESFSTRVPNYDRDWTGRLPRGLSLVLQKPQEMK